MDLAKYSRVLCNRHDSVICIGTGDLASTGVNRADPHIQGACHEITAAVNPAAGQSVGPPRSSRRRAVPPSWAETRSTPASRRPAMPCGRLCWRAAPPSPASSAWKTAACAPSRSRSAPAVTFASIGSSGKRCATTACTSRCRPTSRPNARSARPSTTPRI